MIIRPAQPGDAEAIGAIINALVRDTLVTFTTVEKTTPQLRADIAENAGDYLVAELAGQVVGYACFGAFRSGPGYRYTAEHTIHLAAAAQGSGMGRALLLALEEVATEAGIHVLVAGISSANPAGLRFHAAMGYSVTGHLSEVGFKNSQWLDTVFMQKILSPGALTPADGSDKKG